METALRQQIEILRQRVESEAEKGAKRVKIDLREDFNSHFLDKIGTKFALGDSEEYRSIKELDGMSFYQAIARSTELSRSAFFLTNILTGGWYTKLGLCKPFNEFEVLRDKIRGFVYKTLEERTKMFERGEYEPKRSNILDFLILENSKLKEEGKEVRTPDEICQHILDVFRAGIDTIMFVFEIVFTYLSLPSNRARLPVLRNIIKKEFSGEDYSTDALIDHPYLHPVFMEAERLFPGLNRSFSKTVVKPFKLCGVKIRRGDDVVVRFVSLNYNKENFERPEEYRPGRFVEKKVPQLTFLPFSHGARSCVGRTFGDFMIKIMVVELLKVFDFSFDEGYDLRAFHTDMFSGLMDRTMWVEVLGE